jgi:hypothetical protein
VTSQIDTWILNLETGALRPLAADTRTAVAWLGDWVYFIRQAGQAGQARLVLFRVRAMGGREERLIDLPPDCEEPVTVSRDGKRVACAEVTAQQDVRVIEDVDGAGSRWGNPSRRSGGEPATGRGAGGAVDLPPVSVVYPWWPVLRCRLMAGFEVSPEDGGRPMRVAKAKPRIGHVVCVDNRDYPASLVRWKVYQLLSGVQAAQDGFVIAADELGESYAFPAYCFKQIESDRRLQRVLNRRYPGEMGWWVPARKKGVEG